MKAATESNPRQAEHQAAPASAFVRPETDLDPAGHIPAPDSQVRPAPPPGEQEGNWLRDGALFAVVLAGLALTIGNYLLFHSLAELFSVSVAFCIFMIAWNSRRITQSSYVLFIGVAYLFVGAIDLIHTLAYKGMGVFPEAGTNLATQLWIGARYIESISLLLAMLFIDRRFKLERVVIPYAVVVAGILTAIFVGVFPVCFLEGSGLTIFKKASEYIIAAMFAAALVALYLRRARFDRHVAVLLGGAAAVSVGSELAFTLYKDAYGFYNLIGHYLKIGSFYLIYRAVVVTGLRRPYDLLFRDLKQSEQRFRRTFDQSPVGAAMVSLDRRILRVNDRLCRISGYSAAELARMRIDDLTHPEDLPTELDGQRQLLEGRAELFEADVRYARRDGGVVWVHISTKLMRNADGSPAYYLPMVEDITPRKQAEGELREARDRLEDRVRQRTEDLQRTVETLQEEVLTRQRTERALRRSEQRYREIVETAEEGIWLLDQDDRTVLVNRKLAEMLGYSPEEMIGRSAREFMAGAGRNLGQAADERADEHLPDHKDLLLVRKDGQTLWTIVSTTPVMDESAGRSGLLAMVTDITSRKRAEESLREANELLERLFDTIGVQIACLDRELNFVRVNRAFAEADGRNVEDYPGRNYLQLFPNPENEAIFRKVLETGEPYFARQRALRYTNHPERGVSYWDWSLQPVRDVEGEVAGLVLCLVDVTEGVQARRELEHERKRLVAVLDMLPAYVTLRDKAHRIRFANHKFLDLFGEPGHRPCYEIIKGRRSPCQRCESRKALEDRIPAQWEWISRDQRAYQVFGYPFSDVDGAELVLELGIDITERKDLEEKVIMASEVERQRIGQDLHDGLGQNLTGLAFLSKALARKLRNISAPLADEASEIAGLINRAIGETRAIARGLCPVGMGGEGLMNALREMAVNVQSVFKLPCYFRCTEPIVFEDKAVASHLYFIAHEAVNNAVRHGKPKNILIALRRTDHSVTLSVQDDGCGLPENFDQKRGMGLNTMKHRASVIGAALSITRGEEGGTVVSCSLARP